MALPSHQFAALIDVLITHVEAARVVNFGDQCAELDRAAAISRPYDVALLMIVKKRRRTHFTIGGIADRTKSALVVIDFHVIQYQGQYQMSAEAKSQRENTEQTEITEQTEAAMNIDGFPFVPLFPSVPYSLFFEPLLAFAVRPPLRRQSNHPNLNL